MDESASLGPHFVTRRDADGVLHVWPRPDLSRWRAKKVLMLGAISVIGIGLMAASNPPYSLRHVVPGGFYTAGWGLFAARLSLTQPRWTARRGWIGYERRSLLARRQFRFEDGQIEYRRTEQGDLLAIRSNDRHRHAPWQAWLSGYYVVGVPHLDLHPVVHAVAESSGLPIHDFDGTAGCSVCKADGEARSTA